jgi:beta-glucanase (GH16 family)
MHPDLATVGSGVADGSRRAALRTRALIAGVVVILAAAGVVGYLLVRHSGNGKNSGLVWSDEFTGAQGAPPDPANWSYQVGGNGWGNNELECYTTSRDNSALDGTGNLVITARSTPGHVCADGTVRDYTSARLTTKGLHSFSRGRLVVRARIPTSSGSWPAFWALGENHDIVGWPQSGEIDVMEAVGSEPGVVHGSLHGPSWASSAVNTTTGERDVGPALQSGFHIFEADWSDQAIAFSVDGFTYFTATRADVTQKGAWVWDQPFYLLLNLAVGGNFPGNPGPSATWPQRYVIDYVRVYR